MYEYPAIDIGRYSLYGNYNMAECFPEKSRWCFIEQICQWVKFEMLWAVLKTDHDTTTECVCVCEQVQFDEWQDMKVCTIIINDDSIFEGRETFYVELIEPAYTLLGQTRKVAITISDTEDGSVSLSFMCVRVHVHACLGACLFIASKYYYVLSYSFK